jgi:hypothetical protein
MGWELDIRGGLLLKMYGKGWGFSPPVSARRNTYVKVFSFNNGGKVNVFSPVEEMKMIK